MLAIVCPATTMLSLPTRQADVLSATLPRSWRAASLVLTLTLVCPVKWDHTSSTIPSASSALVSCSTASTAPQPLPVRSAKTTTLTVGDNASSAAMLFKTVQFVRTRTLVPNVLTLSTSIVKGSVPSVGLRC